MSILVVSIVSEVATLMMGSFNMDSSEVVVERGVREVRAPLVARLLLMSMSASAVVTGKVSSCWSALDTDAMGVTDKVRNMGSCTFPPNTDKEQSHYHINQTKPCQNYTQAGTSHNNCTQWTTKHLFL